MIGIEIVRLRTAEEQRTTVADLVRSSLGTSGGAGPATLEVFCHHSIATDLCVLVIPTDPSSEFPSAMGLQLANALREYGLVEHSAWRAF